MKLSLCSPRRLWMGLSFSSLPSLSLYFSLTNIDTHWHKHTASLFSNISCPLLFLWMHFYRYKNSHAHTHAHQWTHIRENRSFQHIQSHIVHKMFSLGLSDHIDRIQPNRKRRVFLFFLLVVCVFSDISMSSVYTLWITLSANQQLQQCWGVECRWLTCLPSYESHDCLSELLKATHS